MDNSDAMTACLTDFSGETFKWVIGKQCRSRSDAASDQGLHYLQIV